MAAEDVTWQPGSNDLYKLLNLDDPPTVTDLATLITAVAAAGLVVDGT